MTSSASRDMSSSRYGDILRRIDLALTAAQLIFSKFTPGAIAAEYKRGHDPVTEADRELDAALRHELLREGEGWLSEETADDFARLDKERVWIVDPLDGTREFVAGLPEFCVSIGLAENGVPVAGGILNPATNEKYIGAIDFGVLHNGQPARPSQRTSLDGSLILASRSEVKRGEWKQFENCAFTIKAMGSVAYKLARVSAGQADATFTLTPKNEWDVVAGTALITSAGGFVATLERAEMQANRRNPLLSGLVAGGPFLRTDLLALLESYFRAPLLPSSRDAR